MPRVPHWRRYLRFWRPDVAADVDDELRFHFEARAEELRARGLAPADVARTIAEEFGDVEATRRGLREIGERVERRRERQRWWHQLRTDLRYAVRGLRRTPGFAAAVVATLALGIGANAAIFAVVDRLLFRLPPMLDAPARTHRVYLGLPTPDGDGEFFPDLLPYPFYRQLADGTHAFARTALYADVRLPVGPEPDAPELPVETVSASFFGFFDAPPVLGRYFGAAEDRPPNGSPVVVLSDATWRSRFGGRADALGATLRIGATTYTVVGVVPPGFVGAATDAAAPVAFIPISAYEAEVTAGQRRGWWTSTSVNVGTMLVQRRPDVSAAVAQADLTAAMMPIWKEWMGDGPLARFRPRVVATSLLPERGPNQTSAARVAALVGAMALVVLLIACANVANLLLARALRRRREIAVRLAIGVSRRRLLAQLLTESLLLAALGGLAGLLVARWSASALHALFAPPGAESPVLGDTRTLAFVGVAVLVAGVLTGLAPAWQAGRVDVTRHLRTGLREWAGRSRLRVALLVLQGALSVLLLVGAGLFVRSLRNATRIRLGYDVAPVLTATLDMHGVRLDTAHTAALRERLLDAARRVPGVERAALVSTLPLRGGEVGMLRVPGIDSMTWRRLPDFHYATVSPDYFAVMGTRIVRGRGIARSDIAEAPGAMVVSATMARTLWPGQDAMGRCVRVGHAAAPPCTYVVGVAEDTKATRLHDDPSLYYYVAAAQMPPRRAVLVVRTHGDAPTVVESMRRALQREMPGAARVAVAPFADVVDEETRSWRMGATMFVVFGALALTLAAVGLYAVIAYDVAQRSHEIGVRITLGARPGDVVWLGVRQGMTLGIAGIGIGGAVTLAAAGRLAPLLFEVSPHDPLVYAAVAAAMLAVAAAASVIPARRAARVDPNVVLRSE
ncbi:MAG: ABC transporter permease [Gemmatirosa sp.]|nr:ABC transporter permease [Gemmatirosa sp.]